MTKTFSSFVLLTGVALGQGAGESHCSRQNPLSNGQPMYAVTGVNRIAQGRRTSTVLSPRRELASSNLLFAAGGGGTILRSRDSGETWDVLTSGTTEDLHGVFFHDSYDGIVAGGHGTILRTTDSRATWLRVPSGTDASLADITFTDSNIGFAVGAGQSLIPHINAPFILRTTDGGVTWTRYTYWETLGGLASD